MDESEVVKTSDQTTSETPTVLSPAVSEGKQGFDPQDIEKHKAVACLSYISILFLIPLLTQKNSTFAQFHAKQGMVLFITWVIVSAVLSALSFMFTLPLANLFFVVVSIVAIVKTLQGETWEIPGISGLVKTFNV